MDVAANDRVIKEPQNRCVPPVANLCQGTGWQYPIDSSYPGAGEGARPGDECRRPRLFARWCPGRPGVRLGGPGQSTGGCRNRQSAAGGPGRDGPSDSDRPSCSVQVASLSPGAAAPGARQQLLQPSSSQSRIGRIWAINHPSLRLTGTVGYLKMSGFSDCRTGSGRDSDGPAHRRFCPLFVQPRARPRAMPVTRTPHCRGGQ